VKFRIAYAARKKGAIGIFGERHVSNVEAETTEAAMQAARDKLDAEGLEPLQPDSVQRFNEATDKWEQWSPSTQKWVQWSVR